MKSLSASSTCPESVTSCFSQVLMCFTLEIFLQWLCLHLYTRLISIVKLKHAQTQPDQGVNETLPHSSLLLMLTLILVYSFILAFCAVCTCIAFFVYYCYWLGEEEKNTYISYVVGFIHINQNRMLSTLVPSTPLAIQRRHGEGQMRKTQRRPEPPNEVNKTTQNKVCWKCTAEAVCSTMSWTSTSQDYPLSHGNTVYRVTIRSQYSNHVSSASPLKCHKTEDETKDTCLLQHIVPCCVTCSPGLA